MARPTADSRPAAALYVATLLLFFVASFSPDLRLWGFGYWGFFPVGIRILILVVGLAIPGAIYRWRFPQQDAAPELSAKRNRRSYLAISVVTIAVLGGLFYLLRARTFFLGDGYTLLAELSAENPLIKGRGVGEGLAHVWLKSLIGGEARQAALRSYQFISIGSGILFSGFVFVAAAALFDKLRVRICFAAGMLSGGCLLLFFGYVENYSLFCLSICLFTLTGLLITKGKLSRWVILVPFGFAIFFHVLGTVLVPAATYVLFRSSKIVNRMAGWDWKWKGVICFVLFAGAILLFANLYRSDYFFRFAFVPITENQFTVDRYTLFSANHLLDFGNLLFVLMPGLLVMIVSFGRGGWRELAARPSFRFLLILVIPSLLTAFVLDPKPGMPRDWDLFSFPAVPMTALAMFGLLTLRVQENPWYKSAVLVIASGVLSLLPRVLVIADFDRSVAQVRAYYAFDRAKSAPIRSVLSDLLAEEGRLTAAQREATLLHEDYPEADLLAEADRLVQKDSCFAAVELNREVLRLNPLRSGAWASIGYCLNRLGMQDSALTMLRIADGLNPYNPEIQVQLARVYFNLGDTAKAERLLLEAHRLSPKMLSPLQGLTAVYRSRGDVVAFTTYFAMLQARTETPKEYFLIIGDDMARHGEYRDAATCYREALRRGLDSALVKTRITEHPQLREFL